MLLVGGSFGRVHLYLDLLKVIFCFVPWEITIRPPLVRSGPVSGDMLVFRGVAKDIDSGHMFLVGDPCNQHLIQIPSWGAKAILPHHKVNHGERWQPTLDRRNPIPNHLPGTSTVSMFTCEVMSIKIWWHLDRLAYGFGRFFSRFNGGSKNGLLGGFKMLKVSQN